MAVTSGTKLGPYEIVSALGAGGMGEVYRARDTRLDREVAIKVLATHLSVDPDLKARFEREARAISSLSHQHICYLYDVGTDQGTDYLVMELLQGETLAERLRRGPLPLPEVLKIAMELAEALEVAHRQGIVHRDLKPGNIMLTKSGVKLMDFGLAKPLTQPAAATGSTPSFTASPTLSSPSPLSPLTTAGSIVGTIQYMSPEQVEGKDADARSDVFALGSVLYEMVTGQRAFQGKSQLSVASSILERDPEPLSSIQPQTPSVLEQLIRTCLAKDPEERWQTAHDVKLQLRAIQESGLQVLPAAPSENAGKKNRETLAWAVAGLLAAAVIVFVALYFGSQKRSTQVVRSSIAVPEKASSIFMGDEAGPPTLSPDAKTLAFVATSPGGTAMLWVRPLDSLEARTLPGTEHAWGPFWSPNSRFIGFAAEGKLKTIDVNGGGPSVLCDAVALRGGSWGRDGTIIFSPDFRDRLYRVPASGGTPRPVTHLDAQRHTSHRWPFFLPDGKHFLYLAINHEVPRSENDGLYFASLDGKEDRLLMPLYANATYAAGYLLYMRDNQLYAQLFDPDKGVLNGEPQRVADGVANDGTTWRGVFSASENGMLAYAGGGLIVSQLAWYDRTGKQLSTVGERLPGFNEMGLSHKGDRVAVSLDAGTIDIWIMDMGRGVRTRLTFGPLINLAPVWSPDDQWMAYASIAKGGSNINRRPAGGGAEELLHAFPGTVYPNDWSRDGKYLLYSNGPIGSHQDIWALPLMGDRKPVQVVPSGPFYNNDPHFSPDGRWVAYESNESGRVEIYVVPFGGGAGKWQVSSSGGTSPRWRRDGKEIFYLSIEGFLTAVPVSSSPSGLQIGPPQQLFRQLSSANNTYAADPGGQRFLFNTAGEQHSEPITLVVNWPAQLHK
jgi:eukaryotic-like serine/threonine-protein kinase